MAENGAPDDKRPWWLDLLINLSPLVLMIGWEYRDDLWFAAQAMWDRLGPVRADLIAEKLRWHRARFEAGGYHDDGGPPPHGVLSRPD